MSWHFEAEGEYCRHVPSGIAAHWSGGKDSDGLLWRGLRLEHTDWELVVTYEVIEQGITRTSIIGDLSRNELVVTTTIAPDATIGLRRIGQVQVLRGAPQWAAELAALAEEAILFLYNQGGRHAITLAPAKPRRRAPR